MSADDTGAAAPLEPVRLVDDIPEGLAPEEVPHVLRDERVPSLVAVLAALGRNVGRKDRIRGVPQGVVLRQGFDLVDVESGAAYLAAAEGQQLLRHLQVLGHTDLAVEVDRLGEELARLLAVARDHGPDRPRSECAADASVVGGRISPTLSVSTRLIRR